MAQIDFNEALAARPDDPKEQAAARARFRRRLYRDRTLSECAVRLAGIIESGFLNSETGIAWPGYTKLAKEIGCDRKTIARSIRMLVSGGHLVVRTGDIRTSNAYTLNWSELLTDDEARGTHSPSSIDTPRGIDAHTLGAPVSEPRGTRVPDLGAPAPPKSVEGTGRTEPVESPPPSQGAISETAEEMFAIYRDVLGELLPVPREITRKREAAAAARLRDSCGGDLEVWRHVCGKVAASRFLTGGGDRGWKADIDWLLKRDSLLKIAEGKFDNHSSRGGSLLDAINASPGG